MSTEELKGSPVYILQPKDMLTPFILSIVQLKVQSLTADELKTQSLTIDKLKAHSLTIDKLKAPSPTIED